MENVSPINSIQKGQVKKSVLLPLILLVSLWLTDPFISKAQNPTDKEQNNNLEEQIQIINNTLASHPAQNNNTKYAEISRITINSKGKLILYKQYQLSSSCTAAREEVFLTDLEPKNISSYAKAGTMVITVGCKDNLGNCVQRFFRNSCDVTFKPESFQKELLVISSANLRNTEQLRNAFSQLIKIANTQNPNDLEDKQGSTSNIPSNNSTTKKISSSPFSLNSPLVFLNPSTIEKRKSVSLTMEDVESKQKEKKQPINQDKKSETTTQNFNPESKEETENLDLDKLLELLLKND